MWGEGLSHLQYADDTLILIKNDPVSVMNLKFFLMCFESMSGLKVNYNKSEVIVMDCDMESQLRAAYVMNFKLGSFLITYLGMPIAPCELTITYFRFSSEKVARRVEPRKGKQLSSGVSSGGEDGPHQLLPHQHSDVCDGFLPSLERPS